MTYDITKDLAKELTGISTLSNSKYQYLEFDPKDKFKDKKIRIKNYIEYLFGKSCWDEGFEGQIFNVNGQKFTLITERKNSYNFDDLPEKIKFVITLQKNYKSVIKKIQSPNYSRIVITGIKEQIIQYAKDQKDLDLSIAIDKKRAQIEAITTTGLLSKKIGYTLKRIREGYSNVTYEIELDENHTCEISKEHNSENMDLNFSKIGAYRTSEFCDIPPGDVKLTINFMNDVIYKLPPLE